jgi:hypothetical protein
MSISGSRHFQSDVTELESSEESEELEDVEIVISGRDVLGSTARKRNARPTVMDNSLKFWSV